MKGTPQKAVIIGAGVAGIAASIRLAALGYRVDVLEANSYPGGKLSEFTQESYRFDAGPSLFTLPEQVDDLFRLAGKDPARHFEYERLPIITEYFYEDGTHIRAYAEGNLFADEVEQKTGEPAGNILESLRLSRELYQMTENVFLRKSLHRLETYYHPDTLRAMLRLHRLNVFQTMHRANSHLFTDPRVVQLFNRYATYNGSDPYQAPATLNVVPALEFSDGAYFPKGGMYSITKALVELAQQMGVQFHYSTRCSQILLRGNRVAGVQAGSDRIEAHLVVSNMDIVGTYTRLLPGTYQPQKLLTQPKSSSALIFYWGIRKRFRQLDLHNIFFSRQYQQEFEHIFRRNTIFHDPTVYVNISSKYHTPDAPAGCENWFTMINVPNNNGQDWDALIEQARGYVLEKMSRMLGTDLAPLIETESILDPRSIEARTSSTRGALYGNSSNNWYAAFLRHANFSRKYRGLYFCGGSVHPGGGIPLCLLSARIVADLVAKRENKG